MCCVDFHVLSGESSGMWWQHVSVFMVGNSGSFGISAQLSVQWLQDSGLCEEPVGTWNRQCKCAQQSLCLWVSMLEIHNLAVSACHVLYACIVYAGVKNRSAGSQKKNHRLNSGASVWRSPFEIQPLFPAQGDGRFGLRFILQFCFPWTK